MKSIVGILVWYQCIIQIKWSLCGSVSRGDYNEVQLFRTPAAYDVETMVLLNDLTKKDKEVGYKIKATLHVAPVWSHSNSEFLLKFTVSTLKALSIYVLDLIKKEVPTNQYFLFENFENLHYLFIVKPD